MRVSPSGVYARGVVAGIVFDLFIFSFGSREFSHEQYKV